MSSQIKRRDAWDPLTVQERISVLVQSKQCRFHDFHPLPVTLLLWYNGGKEGKAMDVFKIVLTAPEQSAFDKFRDKEEAILTKDEFQLLLRKSLVLDAMDGKSGWFGELPEKG